MGEQVELIRELRAEPVADQSGQHGAQDGALARMTGRVRAMVGREQYRLYERRMIGGPAHGEMALELPYGNSRQDQRGRYELRGAWVPTRLQVEQHGEVRIRHCNLRQDLA